MLTFSKSINPSTITSSSVNILNGDKPINPATSISRDNRTVVLNYNSGSLAGWRDTYGDGDKAQVTDLPGNALANTTSEFTTVPPYSTATPYVVSMRPGNSATLVPTNAVITLFTSAPMNSSTLTGAFEKLHRMASWYQELQLSAATGRASCSRPRLRFPVGTIIQVHPCLLRRRIFTAITCRSFNGSFTTVGALATTGAVVTGDQPGLQRHECAAEYRSCRSHTTRYCASGRPEQNERYPVPVQYEQAT